MAWIQGRAKRSSDRLSCIITQSSPRRRVASASGHRRACPPESASDRAVPPASQRVSRAMRQRVGGRPRRGGGSNGVTPPSRPTRRASERSARRPLRDVVEDRGSVPERRPRPVPAGERRFQRLVAVIGVEIAVALPAQRGRVESTSTREAGAIGRQRWRPRPSSDERVLHDAPAADADRAADAARDRRADLVDADGQAVAVPVERARPDRRSDRVGASRGACRAPSSPSARAGP